MNVINIYIKLLFIYNNNYEYFKYNFVLIINVNIFYYIY